MMRRIDTVAICNDIGAEVENNHHVKKIAYLFLFSTMALVLSVSTLTLTANAQPSTTISLLYSVSNSNNTNTGSASGVTQMGICEVGAGGPCNNNNVR